jgi:hypothetical protein
MLSGIAERKKWVAHHRARFDAGADVGDMIKIRMRVKKKSI